MHAGIVSLELQAQQRQSQPDIRWKNMG